MKQAWAEFRREWEHAEETEKKTENRTIRFSPTQIQLLPKIARLAGFDNPSEYIRWLIVRDLKGRARGRY